MTVIRPNSISGITSITAQANEINVFRHNGVLAGLQLNGVNHYTSAGVSTFHTVNVLGNLDVAGVLTYQDVTNIDSLGIGTFRTGINVSGGQLDVGSNIKLGNAGVITATSFSGGLPITSGADNRVITASSASAIQGEANLTFNGSALVLDNPNGANYFEIGSDSSNQYSIIDLKGDTTYTDYAFRIMRINSGANAESQLLHRGTGHFTIKTAEAADILFYTAGNERLRIDSSGRLLVGTTDVGYPAFADNLTIADSANCGITLRSGNSNQGNIYFSDDTGTGTGTYKGMITYNHNTDKMVFSTYHTGRFTIDSSGRLLIATNTATGAAKLQLLQSSGDGLLVRNHDTNYEGIILANASGEARVLASSGGSTPRPALTFYAGDTERLRILSNGRVGINTSSTNRQLSIVDDSGGGIGVVGTNAGIYMGTHTTAGFQANAAIARAAATNYHITNSTAGDLCIAAESTQSILFGTGATAGAMAERLRIDSSGNVTKPNNPSFRTYLTGGTQTVNANADIVYQNVGGSHGSHNTGSHYNTSNGRFTAPVSGRYVFIMMHIVYGNYSNNATYISVNGVNKSAQHFSYTHGNLWSGVTNTTVLSLSAGDYVTTKFSQQTTIYGSQWGSFNGYLLS